MSWVVLAVWAVLVIVWYFGPKFGLKARTTLRWGMPIGAVALLVEMGGYAFDGRWWSAASLIPFAVIYAAAGVIVFREP